jgi:hypothetical protein
VALNAFTGMLARPNLIVPFQTLRIDEPPNRGLVLFYAAKVAPTS